MVRHAEECFDDFVSCDDNDKNVTNVAMSTGSQAVSEPEVDFWCDLCDVAFAQQTILDQHMLLLHGESRSEDKKEDLQLDLQSFWNDNKMDISKESNVNLAQFAEVKKMED